MVSMLLAPICGCLVFQRLLLGHHGPDWYQGPGECDSQAYAQEA